MRTLIFIAVGLALAALLMRLIPATQRVVGASLFTVAWLAVSAWNLRGGLAQGYSLAEELPIHLALFGLPVMGAWGLWWARR